MNVNGSPTAQLAAGSNERESRGLDLEQRCRVLFTEIASGRREAVGELYELVGERLFGLALWQTGSREEAADIVQDVFVKVVERSMELASVTKPLPWLLRITRNQAVDVLRQRTRRMTVDIDALVIAAPQVDVDRRVDAVQLSRHLSELPAVQREAVYLRCFVGQSFAQIGRITGVSLFTAASRYRLALVKLRRIMEVES